MSRKLLMVVCIMVKRLMWFNVLMSLKVDVEVIN